MNTSLILKIAEVVLAVLLVVSILLQSRGTGIGAAFGGGGNVYRTKRGAEKKLFQFTVLVAILFFGISLAGILL
jgi:preprotein translocase subunit SecG